jgi:hypothetical protein
MTDAAIEQRDEAIAEALAAGRSVRAVRREFSLTIAELDAALARCFPLDTAARLRTIRGDLGKLDRLIEVFFTKALAGDVHSGLLTVKAWERKAELLGLDAVQRIDLQITQTEQQPTRHEKIKAALMSLKYGPDWQPSDGNGADGAVSVLSNSDEEKPSHSSSII